MPRYRLSRTAQTDLVAIFDYTVAKFGKTQAKRYADQLHRCMQIAVDFPQLGRPYTSAKTNRVYHRYGCGRHIIFYERDSEGVLVVRILHDAMDFERHL